MLNKINLIGRLVKAPELRRTQSGIAVASFSLAVTRDFKEGGEYVADFIDCVAWRASAEFVAKYASKGDSIAVAGRLQSRKWQDKNGNNRVAWEVVADNVYFFGGKRDSSNTADERDATPGPQIAEAEDDGIGELPF